MKYIVLWSLLVQVTDPCTDSNPFGNGGGITCLVYHGHTERSKVFTDRVEAFQFYNRGLNTYGIDSVKIDSVTEGDLIAVPCNTNKHNAK